MRNRVFSVGEKRLSRAEQSFFGGEKRLSRVEQSFFGGEKRLSRAEHDFLRQKTLACGRCSLIREKILWHAKKHLQKNTNMIEFKQDEHREQ